uniref:J domain-containing protein n=1 Tax=Strigamia maritima TaxID=126957 RepID=T1JCJ0_STRMM
MDMSRVKIEKLTHERREMRYFDRDDAVIDFDHDVTLQELMDEDDILQECKAQNKKLTDFLVRPEIMEEMVNLVIMEPPDDIEEKLKYKYPNIACELLTSDVQQINDSLAGDEALLSKLYTFLETEKPLNPLLASFFSKTMGILIMRKTEVILEFLKAKDDFINLLISHLNTSAIMDLLLRLVTCVENGNLRTQLLNWLNEQRVIQRLVSLIDPTSDEERHSNASQALADIVRFTREQMAQLQEKAEPDPLLQTLEASETIAELLTHIFRGEKNESCLVNGISVLLALLEFKKQGSATQLPATEQSSLYFRPESHEQMTALDAERIANSVTHTLTALRPCLKDFHQLLLSPPHKPPIATTIGLLEQPLGNTRIHIARLISSVVFWHSIDDDLANLGTLDVLLDLFFKFTWNNFLHTQVEQTIGTILSTLPTENNEKKDTHPLLDQLFSQCCLVQRILDAWEDNEQQQAKPGGNRRGYMGHLTKIANHVAENAEKGPTSEMIQAQLKEIPEDYLQKWETFVSSTLAEINKKNLASLVGGHPLQSSSEDDDPEFRDIPFPQDTALQQAFSDYQMQQMTSNFIDQFGFNDDEFGDQEESLSAPLERLSTVNFTISAEENARNSELFERACNERIQPFDDADSDEDVWEEKIWSEISQESSFNKFPNRPSSLSSGLIGATNVRSVRSNSTDRNSSDSEDSESPTSPLARPVATNEEMRMEVDQSESWTANFDSVPMDVVPVAEPVNPWVAVNLRAEPAVEQTDVGWASFGEFTSFRNTSPAITSIPPMAMETSDVADPRYKYIVANTSTSLSSGEISSPNRSNIQGDHDELISCGPDSENTKDISNTKDEDLAENFNFLSSSGLLKTPSKQSTDATPKENGPAIKEEVGELDPTQLARIEEARAKAKEALDKLTAATISPTANGPEYRKLLNVAQGCSLNELREKFLTLAKKYHPDSGTIESDVEKFRKIENAYRVLKAKTPENVQEEVPVEYDIKHTAPQHRHYLNFEGVGMGTPSQRQRQYQSYCVERAANTVAEHRIKRIEATDKNTLLVKDRKAAKKHKISNAIERLVEDMIQESMSKGEFNNLPGQGKPLKMDEHPFIDSTTQKLNQVLINNGFTPDWAVLKKEINQTIDSLRQQLTRQRQLLRDEDKDKWREIIQQYESKFKNLNQLVDKYNLVVPFLHKQMVHFQLERESERILTSVSSIATERRNDDAKRSVKDQTGFLGFFTLLFK